MMERGKCWDGWLVNTAWQDDLLQVDAGIVHHPRSYHDGQAKT